MDCEDEAANLSSKEEQKGAEVEEALMPTTVETTLPSTSQNNVVLHQKVTIKRFIVLHFTNFLLFIDIVNFLAHD